MTVLGQFVRIISSAPNVRSLKDNQRQKQKFSRQHFKKLSRTLTSKEKEHKITFNSDLAI